MFAKNVFKMYHKRYINLIDITLPERCTKPLSEPMLAHCQINPWEHISVNFDSKYTKFSLAKMYQKVSSEKLWQICLGLNVLTHWGRVTHICVSKQTIIGSDNGLSPGRRQAIIWTNAGILLIGPLGTNFSEILIEIYIFSFKKMHLKMSSGNWQPFCLGLNALSLTVVPFYPPPG